MTTADSYKVSLINHTACKKYANNNMYLFGYVNITCVLLSPKAHKAPFIVRVYHHRTTWGMQMQWDGNK